MIPEWYIRYKKCYDENYPEYIPIVNPERAYKYENLINIFRETLARKGNWSTHWFHIMWVAMKKSELGIDEKDCADIFINRKVTRRVRRILTEAVTEYEKMQKSFNKDDWL